MITGCNNDKATERLAADMVKGMDIVMDATPRKRTLVDILTDLKKADDDLLSFTEEQQKDLINELGDKVDDYKYIDDKFNSEIERIASQIEMLNDVKKSLQNNKAAFRKQLAYRMDSLKAEKMPGQFYRLTLVKTKDADLVFASEPTAATYLSLGPEMVRREYSWNTANIKKKVLENPEAYQEFGTVKEKMHVKFTVIKGIKQ